MWRLKEKSYSRLTSLEFMNDHRKKYVHCNILVFYCAIVESMPELDDNERKLSSDKN